MRIKETFQTAAFLASLSATAWVQAASTLNFAIPSDGFKVAENAGAITLTVLRTNDTDTVVSVDYASSNLLSTAGLDYSAVAGTLTFAPGETSHSIVVPILNDGLVEVTETFRVTLNNPTNATVGPYSLATVYITDNDAGGLRFEFSSYSVAEDAGFVLLGVARSDDGTAAESVDFASANVSAASGVDYVQTNGTLIFAADEKVKLFTVPILNDNLKEANKTFRVTLSNPTNQVLGSTTTATITILDNDPGAQFEFRQFWVPETGGALTARVCRGSDVTLPPFTVDFATSNLTALANADYLATTGTLAFAEGELEKIVAVSILNDERAEADEQFKLTLFNPSAGITLGTNPTATITILDTTGMRPHRFDATTVLPNGSIQLSLAGGVHQRFSNYFDLYPIEVSSNLVDWKPLVMLMRTNNSTNALTYTDTDVTNYPTRFYRTPHTNLITPFMFKPTGPFPVGVVSRQLTDPSRRNRYGVSTNGSFMITVWYPAAAAAGRLPAPFEHPELSKDPTVSYGSWTNYMDRLPYLVTHALPDLSCAADQAPYPILLYSPGAYGDHAHMGERGPYLASHGYAVVGIEHFDCFATIFPDGMQMRTAPGTGNLADRLRDLGFILDELTRWNTDDPLFAGRLNLSQVAAMGASYGGRAVVDFGATDPRCKAVIALDPVSSTLPLHIPLLEITTPGVGDKNIYNLATGDAVWFQLAGAEHQQGGTDFYWALYQEPAGLAFCRESSRTMIAYELWFLNKYLKGETGPPLPLAGFPLVSGFTQK